MSDPQTSITLVDEFAEVVGIDTPYSCSVTYADSRDSKYGKISDRGVPISIEYPVESVGGHQYLQQVEDQVAVYNRSRNNYESCCLSTFDAVILAMLPIALDAEDLQLSDLIQLPSMLIL